MTRTYFAAWALALAAAVPPAVHGLDLQAKIDERTAAKDEAANANKNKTGSNTAANNK